MEEFAEVVCDIVGAAEGFGQAMTAEGAPSALWLENSGRNSSTPEQCVEPGDRVFGLGAEFGCELNVASRLALLVIDRAAEDGRSEHFFEAEGLGAKLDVVVVPPTFLAAFVFDGRGDLDDRLAALSVFPARAGTRRDRRGRRAEGVGTRSRARVRCGPLSSFQTPACRPACAGSRRGACARCGRRAHRGAARPRGGRSRASALSAERGTRSSPSGSSDLAVFMSRGSVRGRRDGARPRRGTSSNGPHDPSRRLSRCSR